MKSCYWIYWVLLVVAILLTLASIGMLAGGFNGIYNSFLHHKLQLVPGREANDIWVNVPVPILMRIHMFNLTNPEEFAQGQKPILNEVGPYVYREYRQKEEITYNANGTATYYQRHYWVWDQHLSGVHTPQDLITSINIVPVGAAYVARNSAQLLTALNYAINNVTEQPFVKVPVGKMLFEGYQDPLLDLLHVISNASDEIASVIPPPLQAYDKFAWFYKRNNSLKYDGLFNIYTGETGLDDIGLLDWWNYSNETKFYGSPCNAVKGTAGDIWPSHMNADQIEVFNPDICMTATLYYSKRVEDSFGNPAHRYVSTNRTFANKTYVPEHECFCIDNYCGPTGLLNLETCRLGIPLSLSFPHFLDADPDLLDTVVGLQQPDRRRHAFFIDVGNEVGLPLQLAARLQINLRVQPYKCRPPLTIGCIEILNSVPEVILPMLWFELLSELSEEVSDVIHPASVVASSSLPTIIFSITLVIGVGLTVTAVVLVRRK